MCGSVESRLSKVWIGYGKVCLLVVSRDALWLLKQARIHELFGGFSDYSGEVRSLIVRRRFRVSKLLLKSSYSSLFPFGEDPLLTGMQGGLRA